MESQQWYKKWWVWVIAAVVVAGIVGTIILVNIKRSENEAAKTETTAGTTVAATTIPGTTAPKSIHALITEGYAKVGISTLNTNINKYKDKDIITAIQVTDIGEKALYTTQPNGKTVTYFRFNFDEAAEIVDTKKGEYVAVYGTVNKQGLVAGTIEVDGCHIAAKGDEAKKFFESVKDTTPTTAGTTAPTTKPTTAPTTKATTAPTTTPATQPSTAAPTQAPTTVPVTTGTVEKVLYDENGVKVVWTGTAIVKDYDDEELSYNYMLRVTNNSGSSFYLGTEQSSVNGESIDLLMPSMVEIDSGDENVETNMYLLMYDLKEAGITTVDSLRFKFNFFDTETFDSTTSDFITIP